MSRPVSNVKCVRLFMLLDDAVLVCVTEIVLFSVVADKTLIFHKAV